MKYNYEYKFRDENYEEDIFHRGSDFIEEVVDGDADWIKLCLKDDGLEFNVKNCVMYFLNLLLEDGIRLKEDDANYLEECVENIYFN